MCTCISNSRRRFLSAAFVHSLHSATDSVFLMGQRAAGKRRIGKLFAVKCCATYPAAIRKLILHTCPCQLPRPRPTSAAFAERCLVCVMFWLRLPASCTRLDFEAKEAKHEAYIYSTLLSSLLFSSPLFFFFWLINNCIFTSRTHWQIEQEAAGTWAGGGQRVEERSGTERHSYWDTIQFGRVSVFGSHVKGVSRVELALLGAREGADKVDRAGCFVISFQISYLAVSAKWFNFADFVASQTIRMSKFADECNSNNNDNMCNILRHVAAHHKQFDCQIKNA